MNISTRRDWERDQQWQTYLTAGTSGTSETAATESCSTVIVDMLCDGGAKRGKVDGCDLENWIETPIKKVELSERKGEMEKWREEEEKKMKKASGKGRFYIVSVGLERAES